MTTSSEQASAKIYQFPVRGRFAANSVRETAMAKLNSSQVVSAAVGGSWYHEAAILEDAERVRSN